MYLLKKKWRTIKLKMAIKKLLKTGAGIIIALHKFRFKNEFFSFLRLIKVPHLFPLQRPRSNFNRHRFSAYHGPLYSSDQ